MSDDCVDSANSETGLALLDRYVMHGSRQAIEELVRRNAPWMHAVALRRLTNAQHAEDVVQAVFLIVIQKPPVGLKSEGALAAWLFKVTCHACNRVIRTELRRRRRERIFAMEREETGDGSAALSREEWEDLSPHLDEAVRSLAHGDQEILLLRFYNQKSHADVAAAMGISHDMARKRVQRAIIKLRKILHRRGIHAPGAAMLASGLMAYVTPPESPATVRTALAATQGTTASAHVAGIAKGVAVMLTMNKTAAIAGGCLIALLALLGGGVALFQSRPTASPPATHSAANWQAPFYTVYKLDDTEALKNIPTPYIPERLTYYTINQPKLAATNPSGPPIYVFEWENGQLHRWGTLSGENSRTVSTLLSVILRLKPYEFEAPPEFLYHRISGDWIRRINSTPAQRLDALCKIVQQQSGPAMRFTQRNLTRPTLVVTGNYEYHAPPSINEAEPSVHLYIDDSALAVRGKSHGSGTVNEVIEELGSVLNMPAVCKITGGESQISDIYHNVDQLMDLPAGNERNQAIRNLLDHVEQQTHLKLSIEQREIPVWVAEPASIGP